MDSLRQKQIDEVLQYDKVINSRVFGREVDQVAQFNDPRSRPTKDDITFQAEVDKRIQQILESIQKFSSSLNYLDSNEEPLSISRDREVAPQQPPEPVGESQSWKKDTPEQIRADLASFSPQDLLDAFNWFKWLRDEARGNNDMNKARSEQAKIDALMSDGRLDAIWSAEGNIYPSVEEINPLSGRGKRKVGGLKSKEKEKSDRTALERVDDSTMEILSNYNSLLDFITTYEKNTIYGNKSVQDAQFQADKIKSLLSPLKQLLLSLQASTNQELLDKSYGVLDAIIQSIENAPPFQKVNKDEVEEYAPVVSSSEGDVRKLIDKLNSQIDKLINKHDELKELPLKMILSASEQKAHFDLLNAIARIAGKLGSRVEKLRDFLDFSSAYEEVKNDKEKYEEYKDKMRTFQQAQKEEDESNNVLNRADTILSSAVGETGIIESEEVKQQAREALHKKVTKNTFQKFLEHTRDLLNQVEEKLRFTSEYDDDYQMLVDVRQRIQERIDDIEERYGVEGAGKKKAGSKFIKQYAPRLEDYDEREYGDTNKVDNFDARYEDNIIEEDDIQVGGKSLSSDLQKMVKVKGKGKKVCMPKNTYLNEHHHLINLLDDASGKLGKEARKQKKELEGGRARVNPGWTKEAFEARQKQGFYKNMTWEQFQESQRKFYEDSEKMKAKLAKQQQEYEEQIKRDPDSEIIWCKVDANGDRLPRLGEHATRRECKARNELAFQKWEEKEHPINAKFFRPLMKGLTKLGDVATKVAPLVGVPSIVTDAYKTFAPPGSEYNKEGKGKKRGGAMSKEDREHFINAFHQDGEMLAKKKKKELIELLVEQFGLDANKLKNKQKYELESLYLDNKYPGLDRSEVYSYESSVYKAKKKGGSKYDADPLKKGNFTKPNEYASIVSKQLYPKGRIGPSNEDNDKAYNMAMAIDKASRRRVQLGKEDVKALAPVLPLGGIPELGMSGAGKVTKGEDFGALLAKLKDGKKSRELKKAKKTVKVKGGALSFNDDNNDMYD